MAMILQSEDTMFGKEEYSCENNNWKERNPKSIKKGKKKVSFCNNVLVCRIRHIDDMKEREIKARWYESTEYKAMKSDIKVTIEMILNKKPLNPESNCDRGLENLLPGGMKRRRRYKNQSIFAVLDEQEEQIRNHHFDSQLLANVYGKYSSPCQSHAQQIGLLDERIVKSMYGLLEHHSRRKEVPVGVILTTRQHRIANNSCRAA